jgi:3-hydroxyacyl-[acyl-carrier-protein] dehydratase
MPPEPLFDLAGFDMNQREANIDQIREFNLQRHEMEQLDAVVYLNADEKIIIGIKDVRDDEFWARGHMPGYPIMPGVIMVEAAAQLCSYYVRKHNLLPGHFFGFLGLENVRFRGRVHPGDRMVIVAKAVRIHRRQTVFNSQAFVKDTMVFHGDILGIPLNMELGGTPPSEET